MCLARILESVTKKKKENGFEQSTINVFVTVVFGYSGLTKVGVSM